MGEIQTKTIQSYITKLISFLGGVPWNDLIDKVFTHRKKKGEGAGIGGMYEVMDLESTLEIKNIQGTRATFHKRKKIKYLQDGIIAYQDYAWGDGEILLNYRTNLGKPVDRYRTGYKTYILISLREVKNKGDIDEFNIQWNIRNGFLTEDGYWSTDVSQPTHHMKVNIIFPKTRQPHRLFLEACNRKQSHELGNGARKRLPDGRWLVTWETNQPELYEVYALRWTW